MKIFAALAPVVTFFFGQIWTTTLDNIRYKRKQERDLENRRERRGEKRHEMQLKTLLEMQDVVLALHFRGCELLAIFASNRLGRKVIPLPQIELSEFRNSYSKFVVLSYRILDKSLRTSLRRYGDFIVQFETLPKIHSQDTDFTKDHTDSIFQDYYTKIEKEVGLVQEALGKGLETELRF